MVSHDRRSFLKAAGGAAAAATTVTAGCLGGGGGGGNGGKTLTYSRGQDSQTLDPQATTSGEDAKVLNQIFDRLIHFKSGGTSLQQGLAKEFSLQGKQAKLTLRKDAKFHDGESFTADDFVATYRRFVDSDYKHFIGDENQSVYGPYLLSKVKNVKKDGKHKLTIDLKQKYAPFLANLAVFALAVLSKKQIENDAGKIKSDPVGTGPFSFEKWNTGNGVIRLTANKEYWGDGPKLGGVVFEAITENSTRASSLVSGETHIVDGLGVQAAKQVKNGSGAKLEKTEGMNIGYMPMNMARKKEFRSKKVRQAINYAINTKAIVENIYKGMATQASHPLPPGVMGYNESLDPYPHDPDKAKKLLEEAGYKDGFKFELATMTNPRPYFPSPSQTANAVKSDLAKVNIDVTIKKQSWDPHLNYIGSGKHDACFIGWMSDNGDPDNFYYPLLHPQSPSPSGKDWMSWDKMTNTGNYAAWANEKFMNLTDKGQKTSDDAKRKEFYKQAGQIAHDEAPWVFVTHTEVLRGVHKDVKNFTIAPISGPFLTQVEL
ncbi:ABC transporter substrate-binding protein [Haladaptatus salinisoli]|uniref:ABC transporter substrate-binding protein n=1 Tax=Haladaptatus salinisoli TaxID=2884876 RepID=UPI001D0AFF59|nr:ABC transporter substrate-binding protein [Haladaptatus salinisoli]